MNNLNKSNQAGSAFFYILVAVVLFGSLAYMVSRDMRSQSTQILSQREAELMASDILDYAQKIEMSVNQVLEKDGMSESTLSFYNELTTISDYENTSCTSNECLVFHGNGGDLTWQNPPENAADMTWHFTNNHRIPNYDGTGHAGVVLHLPKVKALVCEKINQQLGHEFESIPEQSGSQDATSFMGSYQAGFEISCNEECDGFSKACYHVDNYSIDGSSFGDAYVFYYGVYVFPSE